MKHICPSYFIILEQEMSEDELEEMGGGEGGLRIFSRQRLGRGSQPKFGFGHAMSCNPETQGYRSQKIKKVKGCSPCP